MSWVHIGDGRFRTPIPRSAKHRWGNHSKKNHFKQNVKAGIEGNKEDGANANANAETNINLYSLTQDTIPSELRWTKRHDDSDLVSKNDGGESTKSAFSIKGGEFWISKGTSCDLELDTTGKRFVCLSVGWLIGSLSET